jgi:hypothetical protein
MADIRTFRGQKRLKSLDEIDRPRWKWDTLPAKSPSPYLLILAGLAIGAFLGVLLFV